MTKIQTIAYLPDRSNDRVAKNLCRFLGKPDVVHLEGETLPMDHPLVASLLYAEGVQDNLIVRGFLFGSLDKEELTLVIPHHSTINQVWLNYGDRKVLVHAHNIRRSSSYLRWSWDLSEESDHLGGLPSSLVTFTVGQALENSRKRVLVSTDHLSINDKEQRSSVRPAYRISLGWFDHSSTEPAFDPLHSKPTVARASGSGYTPFIDNYAQP